MNLFNGEKHAIFILLLLLLLFFIVSRYIVLSWLLLKLIAIIIVAILSLRSLVVHGDMKDCGTISFYSHGFYSRRQCIFGDKQDEKRRKAEMPSAAGKVRGISEIYTRHKRREGVVKVFRCKISSHGIVRVKTMSDEFLNPPPPHVRGERGWHSSVVRVPDSMWPRARLSLLTSFLPIVFRASHRYHC